MTSLRSPGRRLFTLLLAAIGSALLSQASQLSRINTPLYFEPNAGQAPSSIAYLSRDGMSETLFRKNGISLMFPTSTGRNSELDLTFVGSNANPIMEGVEQLIGTSSYFNGNNPSRWLHGLPNYAKLRYRSVYPGIDLIFYGNDGHLEHDFTVQPGADPSRIAVQIEGSTHLDISSTGDLEVHLPNGELTLKKPIAYQDLPSGRQDVAAAFILHQNGRVTFHVGAYDTQEELTIDPVVTYSTYLAAVGAVPSAIAVDAAGNSYITGTTYSNTYPVSSDAFQTNCDGCSAELTGHVATFVTKIDSTGTTQLYSTFLAGTAGSQPFSIAVDANGNAIIAGSTASLDFPLKNQVGSSPPSYSGGQGAFVSSLSPNGSSLNYSTYIGFGVGEATGVAVDKNGNAYVAGMGGGLPVTPGALDGAASDSPSAVFIAKFSSSGSLIYNALVGDEGGSFGLSEGPFNTGAVYLALDSQGNAYITGSAGPAWPTTAGVYSGTPPTSVGEVFVAEMSADASKLVYSTYVGQGAPLAIALDAKNNAYVAGVLNDVVGGFLQDPYPVTPNAFIASQPCCSQNGPQYPSFFSQISSDGSKLVYSSYFPGAISGIALDGSGNIWLVALGTDASFLENPIDSQDSKAAQITEFNPTGTKVEFSTFFGGAIEPAGGPAIAIDTAGKAHVTDTTWYGLFTTPGNYLTAVPYYASATTNGQYQDPYGYLAVFDTSVPAPAICLTNSSISDLQYPLSITNCGNTTLTIKSFNFDNPAFVILANQNNCYASFAPGASCQAVVSYQGVLGQSCNGILTIASNTQVPFTLPLGDGGCGFGQFTVSPASISFSSQLVGTTSSPRDVTLSNPGSQAISFEGVANPVATTGDFTQTNTCGYFLAPDDGCSIFISFTPTASGTRTGQLIVTPGDNAPGNNSPVSITLTGTGVEPAPAATLSGSSLTFTPEAIGSASIPQTITLTNSGQVALSVTSVAATGDFSQTNTCATSVAAKASCSISVVFAPTQPGNRTGSLTITDDAVDSPQIISLTGIGPTFALSFTPGSLAIASPGQSASAAIHLTPAQGYTGAVQLSCIMTYEGQGPSVDTPKCALDPVTTNLVGSAASSTTLTVTTSAAVSSSRTLPGYAKGALVVTFCIWIVPLRKRKTLLPLILFCCMVATATLGCGGSSGSGGGGRSNPGTTTGSYQVTVYADSNTLSSYVNIPLTVQ